VLWGRSSINVSNCDIVLSKDAYNKSTILSKADAAGVYKCNVTVDNLNYTSEGICELFFYQIGVVSVNNSIIPKLTNYKCGVVNLL